MSVQVSAGISHVEVVVRLLKLAQHGYFLAPITALAFHRSSTDTPLILAGEGSFLKIFHAEEARLLHQCEIFRGQAIHGITVRDDVAGETALQIVIWGGSSLTLLTTQDFAQILYQKVSCIADAAIKISDWILDASISRFDAVGCVLITAHNTVIRARLAHSSKSPALKTIHSPSRSILYSAHLVWESPSCVVVAAGTVFGEIIVWQCSPSDDASPDVTRVLFTFTGHEGSIFGVNISPPIIGMSNVTRLLASCSDDRTIRLWNLSPEPDDTHSTAPAVQVRETGFGENGTCTRSLEPKTACLATVMGHASRIWGVRFLGHKSLPLDFAAISLLSFGEDSTTNQWGLQVERNLPDSIAPRLCARLRHVQAFAFHSGKHIWSTALQMGGSTAVLATGGADGKIASYEVRIPGSQMPIEYGLTSDTCSLSTERQAASDAPPWMRTWKLDEILEGSDLKSTIPDRALARLPMKSLNENLLEPTDAKFTGKARVKKIVEDAFNRYAFISEDKLIAITTSGRVLLCHITSKVRWSEVALPVSGPEDLRSYAVLTGLMEIGLACLAGTNGNIYIYRRLQNLHKAGKVEGKVADMFKVYNPQKAAFELLVTTLGGTKATLFSFDVSGPQVELVEDAVYHLPSNFVVTSAGRNNNMLVMGSRSGLLALYANMQESPVQIWTHPNRISDDAITSIANLPSPDSLGDTGLGYFLTTSRNGCYSIFSTVNSQEVAAPRVVIHQVHQGTPPFGPMIEAGWFEKEDLFLYGFKGKNFVVWNETKQYEITNVECGGSHRSYAYSSAQNSGRGFFVYTKASKMYLHSHRRSSHQLVKAGGHGREIKACAVSDDESLIATGAEDTAIRIWNYNEEPQLEDHLVSEAVIQKHSAGIQHLQWHGSRYLFSSGGNEEFFIWAVAQIPAFGIGIICEASCPDPSEARDLRIMNFHVSEAPQPSRSLSAPRLLISLAYSDSTIRTYVYSKPEGFCLVATGRYTSSCLTQIRHFRLEDDEIIILTASTDGGLALWKGYLSSSLRDFVPKPVKLVLLSTRRIHQSAIKSLDLMPYNEHILVATGGDDNSLGIVVFPNSGSVTMIAPTCLILRSAHAAAVTGLCLLRDPKINFRSSIRLISTGNDQKVKAWIVSLVNNTENGYLLSIKKVGDKFTPVADVGDMGTLRAENGWGRVLIVGNGMEVQKIHVGMG